MLNRAAKDKLIPDFSRELKQFKKNDVSLKYLIVEQIKTLEATPYNHPAIQAAFLFSCFSGLRVSDLQALQDSDIQESGDRVKIRYKMQKTRKWEWLTLGVQALKYLEKAKELHKEREVNDSRVFMLPGKTWGGEVLRAWGAKAGIPFNLGWHCGRHTFAVMSLQNGVDLYTLSKLMGHANITTTQIYAKVVDETKTAAMDKLPSW